jgi:transaldolase
MSTKLEQLAEYGQSIWLDYISRSLIDSGRLKEKINQGLRGMTSNPTIFDKAVSSGSDYDASIQQLKKKGKSTFDIYDAITVKDIQDAADTFKDIYEQTHGLDGYVSLEINPKLAYQTQETIQEGKRLHATVNRPNVMFKVPSTEEGFQAITALLAEGINVNVTLIFSVQQYVQTVKAYLDGIAVLQQKNRDTSKVRSVASVFVSRIDTATDKLLDAKMGKDTASNKRLEALKGKTAVANCAIIYKKYLDLFSSREFKQLQKKGAHVQRVLWGSTSTKNPEYSDIKYVSELIAKDTVNTIPEKTIEAFVDHGAVKEALTGDVQGAQKIIDELFACGIDINTVCTNLLEAGVIAFEKSFDSLIQSIENKAKNL